MAIDHNVVMKAFRMYVQLARDTYAGKELLQEYVADDALRGLVDQFAREVDCVTVVAGEQLYMIPETRLSPFHVSNDYIKKITCERMQ